MSVTYIRPERMPPELWRADPAFLPLVPDFAADTRAMVRPSSEAASDIEAWLSAGVDTFWDVDIVAQVVRVYRRNTGVVECLGDSDRLTAPDVLPGFAVPVADIFCKPGEPASIS